MAIPIDAQKDAKKLFQEAENEANTADEELHEMQEAMTTGVDQTFESLLKSVLGAKDEALTAFLVFSARV